MCGIVAAVGDVSSEAVREMIDRIAHRGPDGIGIHQMEAIGGEGADVLGHCRLAIIDPAGGRQPIIHPEHRHSRALVANGMIYNYQQLRSALPEARFTTGSDSETIFHSCLEQGADGVSGLDGMFAFVMIDNGRVLAARDPIGIKPLYIGRQGTILHFASEIKALAGLVEEIREFPPGYVFDSRRGTGEDAFVQYYGVPGPQMRSDSLKGHARALREHLEAAVTKRLQSDVPLGCFLSGGLDSSIIAALASRHQKDLKTFAVGVEGSNDLQAARRVADHLGTDHRELLIRAEDVRRDLPEILYHLETYDQDLVRSAVPCWFVSKLAAREVKVVLTGEGADELFAGYRYHKDYRDDVALSEELSRGVSAMHNVNLQRVDRMTMAHGLEARVPFLDRQMIDLAMEIPAALKLQQQQQNRVEKWVLRHACSDLLPDEIVWRVKEQFDEGSGLADLLSEMVPASQISHRLPDGRRVRGQEEAWYAQRLADGFDEPAPFFELAARWSDGRVQ